MSFVVVDCVVIIVVIVVVPVVDHMSAISKDYYDCLHLGCCSGGGGGGGGGGGFCQFCCEIYTIFGGVGGVHDCLRSSRFRCVPVAGG